MKLLGIRSQILSITVGIVIHRPIGGLVQTQIREFRTSFILTENDNQVGRSRRTHTQIKRSIILNPRFFIRHDITAFFLSGSQINFQIQILSFSKNTALDFPFIRETGSIAVLRTLQNRYDIQTIVHIPRVSTFNSLHVQLVNLPVAIISKIIIASGYSQTAQQHTE